MNETIGIKGGKQDRRRTLKITQNKKKKLEKIEQEKEIKTLEQKVKKQQIYTLIKALPIAIGGGFIKTIHDTAIGKQKEDKEEENSRWRIKEYDGDISPTTPIEYELYKLKKQKRKEVITPTGEKIIIYFTDISDKNKENTTRPYEEQFILDDKANQQTNDTIYEPDTTQKINIIKSRGILEEYDKQLKEIRYELRNTLFEFSVLEQAENEIVQKEDAQKILEQLNDIIDRIEILKDKMDIGNFDQYDSNYIYFLIEKYFDNFNNNIAVKDINESPLYIELAEKIKEFDNKKELLKKRVEEKKELLENKEEEFSKLKNKYLSIDKINSQLIKFQVEQEKLLKDIQEKINKSTTITEKVEYELRAINRQSSRMLRFMQLQMLLPVPAIAKVMSASVLSHIIFLNNIVSPEYTKKNYKIITVQDYSSEIKNSISEIDSSIDLLGKTSQQIDEIIKEINTKYKDYLGEVKECDEMLNNLKKIKSNIQEKEFEMEKLKQEQQKELEKNDAKVLTRGKYPVN